MTESDFVGTGIIEFAEDVLGMKLYPWQDAILTGFEQSIGKRYKASLCSPNGAGKDSVVIAALALWWVTVHRRGTVKITSKDGSQIDEQTLPAINRHGGKFEGWRWMDRKVVTPTGGRILLFATDDPRRVEGAHRETLADGSVDMEGPLLLIANEAKSVPDEILDALDRCTFDALLYASSPGPMTGRFYEAHYRPELGFRCVRVGLKDCPHKTPEQINDIITKYGQDSPFTRSTLHGEFMEAEGELRFNRNGLDRIKASAETFEAHWRAQLREHPEAALIGELHQQEKTNAITWLPDYETGWLWCAEKPRGGCRYIGFCDPMTGAQSEGSLKRDTHAAGILRLAYTDFTVSPAVSYDDEVVAVLHHPDGCRWDNDILAERFALLLHWYQCLAIVEANNSGTEVMRLLMLDGCNLWRRRKRNHKNPGKKLEVVGFQTTAGTKSEWIGALGRAIREQDLTCNYLLAARQFCTFILNEKGTGEAQGGAFDDFVTGVGLALYARESASVYPLPTPVNQFPMMQQGPWGAQPARPPGYGACS